MDRQTLRDWVHCYNESGLAGLYDQPRRNGPPPRLSPEQQAKVAEWVEQGPELERDGVVRWRCIDLQRRIRKEFAVEFHESSVGKLLRKLNFTRRQPRPYHLKKDAAAQEAFKNVWPAPSASGFCDWSVQSASTYPACGMTRPRWRSARPGPHKTRGVTSRAIFEARVPERRFDCQAISLSPP
jgi:putative transposase